MKLAIIMPDLRCGGAERVAVNLANQFAANGYATEMVLLSATGELLNNLHPNIHVVELKAKRLRWALRAIIHYLKHERPAAVLASMWPLTVITICARILSNVPARLVVAEHTTWSRSELLNRWSTKWGIRASMHLFFRKSDSIVCVSKGAADDLSSFACLDRSFISTIYNPVVDSKLTQSVLLPTEPAEWCADTHKRVLAVGTLKEIKDYSTLLNAFSLLLQNINAKLLILGDGECRAALDAQAHHLGIADKVFMPGFVKDPAPYFRHADLHVLSSTGEGFGNVIVEALAEGTPVVSTDCPSGPREILCDGQFGRLVPVGDVQALAAAMQASLTSTHDRAALMARAQDFSIDKASDQYEALLFPALAQRKANS